MAAEAAGFTATRVTRASTMVGLLKLSLVAVHELESDVVKLLNEGLSRLGHLNERSHCELRLRVEEEICIRDGGRG
jgi:hypothetical protein